jgi:hypothetical protein
MPRIGISFEFDSGEFIDYYEYKFGKTQPITKAEIELALIMRFGDYTNPRSIISISKELKVPYETIRVMFDTLSKWIGNKLYDSVGG